MSVCTEGPAQDGDNASPVAHDDSWHEAKDRRAQLIHKRACCRHLRTIFKRELHSPLISSRQQADQAAACLLPHSICLVLTKSAHDLL